MRYSFKGILFHYPFSCSFSFSFSFSLSLFNSFVNAVTPARPPNCMVSTAELGTRDVLKEGQGVWIAKEESAEFSQKIIKMLGNAEDRKILGEKGRKYAQGWSASKQAECLITFYQTVLATTELPKKPLALSSSGAG